MPGTYSKLLYHIAFSTKGRVPMITPDVEPRLHEYLGGIVRTMNGVPIRIGGMPDHVHLLIRWRTDETLAALLRTVKARSSRWVHKTLPSLRTFAWQEGYGAFTVSQSQVTSVARYIATQAEHHRIRSFEEEYLELLRAHEIEFDVKYLWDSV